MQKLCILYPNATEITVPHWDNPEAEIYPVYDEFIEPSAMSISLDHHVGRAEVWDVDGQFFLSVYDDRGCQKDWYQLSGGVFDRYAKRDRYPSRSRHGRSN